MSARHVCRRHVDEIEGKKSERKKKGKKKYDTE